MASNDDLFTTTENATESDDEFAAPSGSEFDAESAVTELPTVEPGAEPAPEADAEPAPEPAPEAGATRKRAARKRAVPATAAAPAPEPGSDGTSAGEPAAAPATASDGIPVKPARRSTRKKAAPAPQEAPDTAAAPQEAPEAVPADEVSAEAPAVDRPTEEAEASDEATDGAGQATAPGGFGLFFQAPAPATTPRRRAARRAEGAPQPVAFGSAATSTARAAAAEPAEGEAAQGVEVTGDLQVAEGDADELDADATAADEGTEEPTTAAARRRRRRGGKGRRGRGPAEGGANEVEAGDSGIASEAIEGAEADSGDAGPDGDEATAESVSRRRTRRRRRSGGAGDGEDAPGVVTRVRDGRRDRDEVTGVRGSTRLEAKKQRRREGREAGRRRQVITEAEFLARRESVDRVMVVRSRAGRTQIGVLEDGVLVEHYVSREINASMAGNIYLGKVQNVLPSMEAAFVDIGRGRNAVLYAGEVNWDAAGMEAGAAKRIENALEPGQSVLVQVTKDPIGHKGARLTSQVSLPGRYLVLVPDSSMTGISRKLPDTERARLKRILREVVPETAGVIVRTAAEGASEEDLRADVERLTTTWEQIRAKAEGATSGRKGKGSAPMLLHGEPDMTVRVIRDVFNEDFSTLVVSGESAWAQVSDYVDSVAPDLAQRLQTWTSEQDVFAHYRIDEQIAKAMDRKVWLPSGGSLVIDRTEAMTVVDVNTGKFVGSGGNLEETVTRNNIEAAEEIVRQLRLRDIGGIIVIDFIDMVLESNRDLVVRRLLECLGRDRTKHQVAEVTSLGLVQMTRKRVGSGLIEVFSETCDHCNGRGYLIHTDPVDKAGSPAEADPPAASAPSGGRARSRRGRSGMPAEQPAVATLPAPAPGGPTPAQIAAAAHAAAVKSSQPSDPGESSSPVGGSALVGEARESGADGLGAELDQPAYIAPADSAAGDEPKAGEPTPAPNEPTAEEGAAAEPAAEHALGHAADQATEPAAEPAAEHPADDTSDNAADPATSSAGRGRRRRGRVVAPAGPPRGA